MTDITAFLDRLHIAATHELVSDAIALEAADIIEALRTEIAALRKDADRYRWLQSHWARIEAHTDSGDHAMILTCTDHTGKFADGAGLDASIDLEIDHAGL